MLLFLNMRARFTNKNLHCDVLEVLRYDFGLSRHFRKTNTDEESHVLSQTGVLNKPRTPDAVITQAKTQTKCEYREVKDGIASFVWCHNRKSKRSNTSHYIVLRISLFDLDDNITLSSTRWQYYIVIGASGSRWQYYIVIEKGMLRYRLDTWIGIQNG